MERRSEPGNAKRGRGCVGAGIGLLVGPIAGFVITFVYYGTASIIDEPIRLLDRGLGDTFPELLLILVIAALFFAIVSGILGIITGMVVGVVKRRNGTRLKDGFTGVVVGILVGVLMTILSPSNTLANVFTTFLIASITGLTAILVGIALETERAQEWIKRLVS